MQRSFGGPLGAIRPTLRTTVLGDYKRQWYVQRPTGLKTPVSQHSISPVKPPARFLSQNKYFKALHEINDGASTDI